MEERSIYKDISERTGGDVYIGVVGPVRTGKSTFIKRFMDNIVIPNIKDEDTKARATDELPQSSGGRTIMTTEPKFIPEEAVQISLDSQAFANVRMIDCVGYVVPSALGHIEDNQPRMVKTPWSEEAIPFETAAEIGTKKVINDHSTIGLVITTDGSISDIPRDEYEEGERRVINELKQINKPFIVLLNSVDPTSKAAKDLAAKLSEEHKVSVLPVSCMEMDEAEIKKVLSSVLFEFHVKEINVNIPSWIVSLEKEHWLKQSVFESIRQSAGGIKKIRQVRSVALELPESEYIAAANVSHLDLGKGAAELMISVESDLFYKVLSEKTGLDISSEAALMESVSKLSDMQKEYDKIALAYEQVLDSNYGIVMPTMDELSLEEPQIIKQNGKYGIRLRASAPSIHMMKIMTTTEVTPIVGSEQQSQELVNYLLKEFEEDPQKIWDSNIFGKSVHELVNEGLHNKLYRMPQEARGKIKETIEKIINDGCNGLICIII